MGRVWLGVIIALIAIAASCVQAQPDVCLSAPCQNGGTCDAQFGSYSCDCRPGYEGVHCEREMNFTACRNNACQGMSACVAVNDTVYYCICPLGVYGTYCEYGFPVTTTTPDPCLSSPCLNNGVCVREADTFHCECAYQYYGRYCQYYGSDPCLYFPCSNGGSCVTPYGQAICSCPPGYSGIYCEEVPGTEHPCDSAPCLNGGSCTEYGYSLYLCSCPEDYYGPNCGIFLSDPCESYFCYNSGECSATFGVPSCTCPYGFYGEFCERGNEDSCSSAPCLNGGSCYQSSLLGGTYICICQEMYHGDHCEISGPDLCKEYICENEGTCVNPDYFDPLAATAPYCLCSPGFTGPQCEDEINGVQCGDDVCYNGGSCVVSYGGEAYCKCAPGFFGQQCEQGMGVFFSIQSLKKTYICCKADNICRLEIKRKTYLSRLYHNVKISK
ncbi:fibropellin-1-like [Lytechinus variegatus]|uniref:fibropellin-1-like n=1 Tax=Lytechinus variegatus TaxID=7654 RepID=UPI001BB1B3F7|nr:fibropellin-1-like [Lytechinus variegatus]